MPVKKQKITKTAVKPVARPKAKKLKFGKRIISTRLAIFVILFAAVGAYFLIKSFAAPSIILFAPNLDVANSTGASVLLETSSSSKRNQNVVQLSNPVGATTAKAAFIDLQGRLDTGVYSVCLSSIAKNKTIASKLQIVKYVNAVPSTIVSESNFTQLVKTEYSQAGCINYTNSTPNAFLAAVVKNTTDGGIMRIGNILFKKIGNIPPPPPTTSAEYCPLDKVGIPPNCLTIGSTNSSGEFIIKCTLDHSAMDDPIVKPNQPGQSHSHDFYGLNGVTADPASLVGTSTTCGNKGDTAAYWHPTLLVNGVAQKASLLRVYYQGTNQTHTFPPGFQATAGNPRATSPQSDTITYWGCGSGSSHPKQTTVPQCASGEGLTLHIKMNDCWSGKILPPNTDYTSELSSDGQSKGDGTCPAAFPYHIPAVILDVAWDIQPNPATVSLSCLNENCAHGDFNFGWQPAAFEADMSRCLRAATNCGSVTN